MLRASPPISLVGRHERDRNSGAVGKPAEGGAVRIVVMCLIGAIPFMLGLLFFLSDMMRSPLAAEHLAVASLGLGVLLVWKNVWQAKFAAGLYGELSPGERPGSILRLIAIQGALQPIGLVLMLSFPWLIAFFRNAAIFAALGVPEPLKIARQQAGLWNRQNWGVLALTSLAGLFAVRECADCDCSPSSVGAKLSGN